jgi:uncharacterized protein (TIGR03435 family)
MKPLVLALCGLVVASQAGHAQPGSHLYATPQRRQVSIPTDNKFDVASVKSNKSGDNVISVEVLPTGLTALNVSLRRLVLDAFSLPDTQVAGGPPWFANDRFDVRAKTEESVPPQQITQMLQALLADRFRLIAHLESRPIDIYALVLARDASSLGPELHSSTEDCGTSTTPVRRPECSTQMAAGLIMSRGTNMETLALNLSRWAGRQVVDRTGLPGRFDARLRWTQNLTAAAAAAAQRPSLFVAIQEQLGLKLEPTREPMDVLVVDSAQPPTED